MFGENIDFSYFSTLIRTFSPSYCIWNSFASLYSSLYSLVVFLLVMLMTEPLSSADLSSRMSVRRLSSFLLALACWKGGKLMT